MPLYGREEFFCEAAVRKGYCQKSAFPFLEYNFGIDLRNRTVITSVDVASLEKTGSAPECVCDYNHTLKELSAQRHLTGCVRYAR